MELRSLAATHQDAVCNDGSSAGYYWTPSSDPHSTDWVVFFESGGFCWDSDSCSARCKTESYRCSSKSWSRTHHLSGIMASTAPRLALAHKILVPYCTSDTFLGNTRAFGFEFRGFAVLRAVLHEAVAHGLGKSNQTTRVLFGGVSAGARGASALLDRVRDLLPLDESERARVQVHGYIDSALWTDMQPFRHGPSEYGKPAQFFGLANATRGFYSFANVTHHATDGCASLYPDERWKCLFGAYRLPQLRTPFMTIESQFDTYQLDHNFGCPDWGCGVPHTAEERAFAWQLARRIEELARNLTTGERFVYSSRCHDHATSLDAVKFAQPGCGGVSLEAALVSFLSEPAALPRSWIDTRCEHFDCCCRGLQFEFSMILQTLAALCLACGAAVLYRRLFRRWRSARGARMRSQHRERFRSAPVLRLPARWPTRRKHRPTDGEDMRTALNSCAGGRVFVAAAHAKAAAEAADDAAHRTPEELEHMVAVLALAAHRV